RPGEHRQAGGRGVAHRGGDVVRGPGEHDRVGRAALDDERGAVGAGEDMCGAERAAQRVEQRLQGRRTGHAQKRWARPRSSIGCGREATGPASPQDFLVGKTLPGLQSPVGLNAAFSRCMKARSASEKMNGMKSDFSSPMPCSPEIEPPTSAQTFMISAPAATTRDSSPSLRGSYRMFGCRLPSPAWNTLPTRSPDAATISFTRPITYGSRVRGITPSITI